MAVNKNFVVKNGLEVNTNLLVADLDTQTVGIGTTIAPHELHVVGGIGVTNLNVTGVATIANLRIGGISTFVGFTTFLGDINVGGASTFTGLVDINGGGQANTFKVEDLTDNRVVIAGSGGELEDDGNFTFDGSQLILGVGATVGGALTVAGATDLNGAVDVSGETNFSSGVGIADSIFHIGDDNTQIRFPSADTFTVETGGSERLRVASGGNIGIGSQDPQKLLDLTASNNGGNENNTLRFVDRDVSSGADQQTGRIEFFTSDVTQPGVQAYILGAAENAAGAGGLRFATGTAGSAEERVRITSAGNIGIGTNDPNRRLVVRDGNGGTHSQAVASINLGDDSTFNDGILGVKNAGNRGTRGHANGSPLLNCEFSDGTGLILDKDGNLGIGTSNPTGNNAVDAANESVLAVGIATARKVFSDSLEVGGSQVISDARQLQNIASLDSTTTATIESAIANAPNTFTDLQVTGIATFKNDVEFHGANGITSSFFDQSDNSLKFVDSAKAKFGTDNDLEIYHDGANSYIDESGNGVLNIRSNRVEIEKYTGEHCAKFAADGAVELYHNNSKKFETTGFGATVFGQLKTQQFLAGVSTFTSNVGIAESIFHIGDTNTSFGFPAADTFTVDTAGSERLRVDSSGDLGIGTANPGERLHLTTTSGNCKLRIDAASAASVDFYNAGTRFSDMFTDASTGNFTITNRQDADIIVRTNGTNERLRVTSGGDLGIGTVTPARLLHLHETSSSATLLAFTNTTTGSTASDGAVIGIQDNESLIVSNKENNHIEFHTDNEERLRITSAGDVDFKGANGITSMSFDRSSNSLDFVDDAKAQFGTDDDLEIYHSGGDSYITNSDGNINIVNSTDGWIRLQPKNGEEGVIVKFDGAVELYHDDSKKFETGSDGVIATGIVTATGGFALGIHSAGTSVVSGPVKTLNFVGSGNTFAYNASTDTIDISIAGGSGGGGGGSGVTETDTTVSTTNPTGVGSFATASFRSASVIAQINQLNTDFQVGRYLMIHDGTTVTVVEESAVSTGSTMLGSFTGVIDGSNVELRVTLASAGVSTVTTKIDTVTV